MSLTSTAVSAGRVSTPGRRDPSAYTAAGRFLSRGGLTNIGVRDQRASPRVVSAMSRRVTAYGSRTSQSSSGSSSAKPRSSATAPANNGPP